MNKDNHKIIELTIGKIRSYDLSEISVIGHFSKLYIAIFTDDVCHIPHFHIFNNQDPALTTVDAAIKLETAEYLKHNGDSSIISSKQIKQLIEFLQTEIKSGLAYWQQLIITWNLNNPNYSIPFDMPMPDYNCI